MQRMMIERARQLIAGGDVDHVLAWEQGEHPWDRVPAVFTAENIDKLKYDTFCGSNLSKYLVAEAAKEKKEEGKKILVFLKPCDTYSYNQLISEHRIDADRVYPIGVGCRGKVDVEKVRALGIKGILDIEDCGDTLNVHTLYGDHTVTRRDVLLMKCECCKGKEHKAGAEFIGESEDTSAGDKFGMVSKLEAMTADERYAFWRGELSKCIRCNACRNVCPACSCIKCVFDNPNSGVANKAAVPHHSRVPRRRTLHGLRRMQPRVPAGHPAAPSKPQVHQGYQRTLRRLSGGRGRRPAPSAGKFR